MDEAEPEHIAVELRLSDAVLARRLSDWLAASEGLSEDITTKEKAIIIADHVPDDAGAPVILLASEERLADWPREQGVVARFSPDVSLVKLRIAIEAAAHGLSVTEAAKEPSTGATAFTERELEVLRHLALGASNKSIARALGISSHTVKFHVASILGKLGASSRMEAVMNAMRLGLIML
jgi:DNA-binding CsgD family transcriptional regulator